LVALIISQLILRNDFYFMYNKLNFIKNE
jgi:hypothetical protein